MLEDIQKTLVTLRETLLPRLISGRLRLHANAAEITVPFDAAH